MTKRWRIFVGLLTVGVCLWLVASLAVAWRLTRRSHPRFDEPAPVGWEGLRLTTSDGQDIGAWIRPRPKGGRHVAVLMLHGNGASRTSSITRVGPYEDCALMLISLRAHGDSSGERNDVGYSARWDVVEAVKELRQRAPDCEIVVQGASLGSAAAVFAMPELGRSVDGYILECPYQDLPTAVSNRMEIYLPWPLDRLAYLGMEATSPLVLPDFRRISPLETISKVPSRTPVLILAGGLDRRARPEEAEALRERIPDQATLIINPKGKHEALQESDPELYRKTLDAFYERVHSYAAGLDH